MYPFFFLHLCPHKLTLYKLQPYQQQNLECKLKNINFLKLFFFPLHQTDAENDIHLEKTLAGLIARVRVKPSASFFCNAGRSQQCRERRVVGHGGKTGEIPNSPVFAFALPSPPLPMVA